MKMSQCHSGTIIIAQNGINYVFITRIEIQEQYRTTVDKSLGFGQKVLKTIKIEFHTKKKIDLIKCNYDIKK